MPVSVRRRGSRCPAHGLPGAAGLQDPARRGSQHTPSRSAAAVQALQAAHGQQSTLMHGLQHRGEGRGGSASGVQPPAPACASTPKQACTTHNAPGIDEGQMAGAHVQPSARAQQQQGALFRHHAAAPPAEGLCCTIAPGAAAARQNGVLLRGCGAAKLVSRVSSRRWCLEGQADRSVAGAPAAQAASAAALAAHKASTCAAERHDTLATPGAVRAGLIAVSAVGGRVWG